MRAIQIKYYGPSFSKGARIVATDGKNRMTMPYSYEDLDKDKLELAQKFKQVFFPHSLPLNPVPSQFKDRDYFTFYPKLDTKKLEDLLNEFGLEHGIPNSETFALIEKFVKEHCVLKESTV